jgi:hypothetical protein
MRALLIGNLLLPVLVMSPAASAEIFRCADPEGGIVFQQTPCPQPAATEPTEAPATESGPARVPRQPAPVAQADEAAPPDPEMVAACKKRYRDEIDRIDAELREGFAPEEREPYRERLRALSQRLSQCDYASDDTTSPGEGSQPAGGDL